MAVSSLDYCIFLRDIWTNQTVVCSQTFTRINADLLDLHEHISMKWQSNGDCLFQGNEYENTFLNVLIGHR